VSRGDLLVHEGEGPVPARTIEAMVCWLSERPLSTGRRYVLRHTTRETKAQVAAIAWRVDLEALEQVSAETLDVTTIGARQDGTGWRAGRRLNLERALRVGDELGGHIVSGHVDGVAEITAVRDEGDSTRVTFRAPDALVAKVREDAAATTARYADLADELRA